MTPVATGMALARRSLLAHVDTVDLPAVQKSFCSFLDAVATATGRATAYNTWQEQEEAEFTLHKSMFKVDRGVYGLTLLLPGVLDRAKQTGIGLLLNNQQDGTGLLLPEEESKLVSALIRQMPPQRIFKMFVELREQRVNNSRTRKIILRTILGTELGLLEYWAVRYRSKIRMSLGHAWGKKLTGIIKHILAKIRSINRATDKECNILGNSIFRYASINGTDAGKLYDIVSFILGNDVKKAHLELISKFYAAHEDFDAGKGLPMEVLEGIRSTFHKDVKQKAVLEASKKTLSKGQRLNVQKKAKAEGVRVEVALEDYDAVKLYIYAYETGLTKKVKDALFIKAEEAATALPVSYVKTAVIVDTSASMFGHKTQKLRPMAVALAMRDMIKQASEECVVFDKNVGDGKLPQPSGDTSLACDLIGAVKQKPEAIFVLTDGYENAPAGRFNEVVHRLREIGVDTPIYQMSPVLGAEAGAIRVLSDKITAMPVSSPNGLGMAMLRGAMEQDTKQGLKALVKMTSKALGAK